MEYIFKTKTNIKIEDRYFAIIACTSRTYNGVYEVIVDEIDWNNENVIFRIKQPCGYVSCSFCEMNRYIFKSEEEAKTVEKELNFGEGLFDY
jgi:hypothetical protein